MVNDRCYTCLCIHLLCQNDNQIPKQVFMALTNLFVFKKSKPVHKYFQWKIEYNLELFEK